MRYRISVPYSQKKRSQSPLRKEHGASPGILVFLCLFLSSFFGGKQSFRVSPGLPVINIPVVRFIIPKK